MLITYQVAGPGAAAETLIEPAFDSIRQRNLLAMTTRSHAIRDGPDNHVRRFANDLDTGRTAMDGALTQPNSHGPAEGHVNRRKLLKRTSRGRASFAPLRQEGLHRLARHSQRRPS